MNETTGRAKNEGEPIDRLWQELQSLLTEASTLLPYRRDDWALACARNAAEQADIWRRLAARADKPAWRYAAARMAVILDRHAATLRDAAARTRNDHHPHYPSRDRRRPRHSRNGWNGWKE